MFSEKYIIKNYIFRKHCGYKMSPKKYEKTQQRLLKQFIKSVMDQIKDSLKNITVLQVIFLANISTYPTNFARHVEEVSASILVFNIYDQSIHSALVAVNSIFKYNVYCDVLNVRCDGTCWIALCFVELYLVEQGYIICVGHV